MKYINKIIPGIAAFGFMIALAGCNKFLDLTPTDSVSDKLVWSNEEYAQLAINDFYKIISVYGQFDIGQSVDGLTEGFTETLKYGSKTNATHMDRCNRFMYATTKTATWTSYDLGAWSDLYEYITEVNVAISNLKAYGDFDTETTAEYMGQLQFFRGFLYFELMKRYKEVILYDEDLSNYKANTALSTEDEGWDMVESDLEDAGNDLPKEWDSSDFGRITKGAAYAFLSRAMLYAERWDIAKAAADSVMNLNLYSLMDDYADAFGSGADGNTEAILEYDYDASGIYHDFDDEFSPGGDDGIQQGGLGTPTQEMVESYELADTGGFPDWSTWHTTSGTTDTPPYDELEPRFQASILYNGASWKDRTIEPYVDGTDGWCQYSVTTSPAGRTTTGYYLRKLIDEDHDLSETTASTQPWIAVRYAEVLLNYAEACYETDDEDDANDAIREIRSRVGLPYTDQSGDDLFDAIRQERKVELAFEGQLFWDMRRWELGVSEYNESRVHGLKIVKNDDDSFTYTYVDCDLQDRYYPEKLYQIPLPEEELENNSAIQQYTEWQ